MRDIGVAGVETVKPQCRSGENLVYIAHALETGWYYWSRGVVCEPSGSSVVLSWLGTLHVVHNLCPRQILSYGCPWGSFNPHTDSAFPLFHKFTSFVFAISHFWHKSHCLSFTVISEWVLFYGKIKGNVEFEPLFLNDL